LGHRPVRRTRLRGDEVVGGVEDGEATVVLAHHALDREARPGVDAGHLAAAEEHDGHATGGVDERALERGHAPPRLYPHRPHPTRHARPFAPPHLGDGDGLSGREQRHVLRSRDRRRDVRGRRRSGRGRRGDRAFTPAGQDTHRTFSSSCLVAPRWYGTNVTLAWGSRETTRAIESAVRSWSNLCHER